MLAFILIPIAYWLPNGCHFASHHVLVPEKNKEENGKTSADFGLCLKGQHYHMATADFKED